jgi:hypothetical protein
MPELSGLRLTPDPGYRTTGAGRSPGKRSATEVRSRILMPELSRVAADA